MANEDRPTFLRSQQLQRLRPATYAGVQKPNTDRRQRIVIWTLSIIGRFAGFFWQWRRRACNGGEGQRGPLLSALPALVSVAM